MDSIQIMLNQFDASTRQVMERLGLNSTKTLFRRRTDYNDPRCKHLLRFLEPGVHFRRKSPDSSQLVWNWEKTRRAWAQALQINGLPPGRGQHCR